jgi:CheY-like chemotaxis protein
MDVHAKTRVLVVEDEPAIRMFLVDALADEGYEVVAAANGAQALDLLAAEQWRPHVIVLDMQMPAMDGLAFAAAYRQSPEPHAPIVVVTAYRAQGRRALELGADEMLIKPVDLETLLDQVAYFAKQSTSQPLLRAYEPP